MFHVYVIINLHGISSQALSLGTYSFAIVASLYPAVDSTLLLCNQTSQTSGLIVGLSNPSYHAIGLHTSE